MDQVRNDLVFQTINELADEVLLAIRAEERELILEFLRSEEWMYESCEDAADAIEDCQHYEEAELH